MRVVLNGYHWNVNGLFGNEIALAKTADGAYPIIGDILPLGSWCDTAVGVAYFRVVNIAAGAYILSHKIILS